LRYPWTGGMNSPQLSHCDLNHDGIEDLFAFDKFGDKVLTYLNLGNGSDTTFYYAPQYEELFPSGLNNWALVRDYNFDSIPDVFTHGTGGTKVYKGSYVNGLLHFDLVCPQLQYSDDTFRTNIWTNLEDIPVFTDVNHDGDLDVLTFGVFGARVEYYENQTKEHAGDPHYAFDSLRFENVSLCWGNFSENTSNAVVLNTSCKGNDIKQNPGSEEQGGPRDGYHAIYAFDYLNDGDVDLLMGNNTYNRLFMLNNCGDSSYANICSTDSNFTQCDIPVNLQTGPAAFGVDVNNDHLEDLLITPNVRSGGRDVNNIMYYKNTTGQACDFQYQGDTFLVRYSLDFGTDSKATFFDFNGDGLQDIVVGNYGYYRPFQTYKSTLAIYQNTGTGGHPEFTALTDDYAHFSNYNLVATHPAFGDLDGDGKADLLLGELNGYVHFFKNADTAGQALFPSMTTPQYFNIDVGQYSAPFIYDVNGDSLNDLVIGRRDGLLSYYWNFGTKTSPLFSTDSVNTNFGGISVTAPGFSDGFSAPFITKDSAGNMLLLVGSYAGNVYQYLIDPSHLRTGNFQLLDNNFLKHDPGSKSTIAVADLNGDGKMEYVVGNSRGGLTMYSDSVWDPGTSLGVTEIPKNESTLLVYPNPAKDYFVCTLTGASFMHPTIELFNMLGEKVLAETSLAANGIHVNTINLSKGLYFVRIIDDSKIYTAKVLVSK
jgi:hypothetical protein